MGKDFGLTLQIDFGVDVGCVNGDTSEPGADGVDMVVSLGEMDPPSIATFIWLCCVQKL
jgi:hypothetical protein